MGRKHTGCAKYANMRALAHCDNNINDARPACAT
jgi:hypothetical protein